VPEQFVSHVTVPPAQGRFAVAKPKPPADSVPRVMIVGAQAGFEKQKITTMKASSAMSFDGRGIVRISGGGCPCTGSTYLRSFNQTRNSDRLQAFLHSPEFLHGYSNGRYVPFVITTLPLKGFALVPFSRRFFAARSAGRGLSD
jgi:hypothetical protein